MKIKRVEPKIVSYSLRTEESDENFFECYWATFTFDCDRGCLNINSDAGNFSHSWGYNENEDFMSLMARINHDYLLDKISDRSVFFLKESIEETIAEIRENGIDYFGIENEEELNSVIEDIKDLSEDIISEEFFFRAVENIVPGIDFEAVQVVKDYPHGAKKVCELFKEYVQPLIKEEIKKNTI